MSHLHNGWMDILSDRLSWSLQDGISYEVACGICADLAARYDKKIVQEKQREHPSQTSIYLWKQKKALLMETRQSLKPSDTRMIEYVIRRFGRELKMS